MEEDGSAAAVGHVAMVRSESLRFFDELVRAKGGDPEPLFAAARLDPMLVRSRDALLPYRQMILLLEHAAAALSCPDFGLQLAHRQFADGILGPLDIAMRNSATVGDAWRFCADHVHAYCSGSQVSLTQRPEDRRWMMRFEILLPRLHRQRQAVEHALLISHLATSMISGGKVGAREVWFAHDPAAGAAAHGESFGAKVRFAQPHNALFFEAADFGAPVVNQDERLLELATFFIDARFPSPELVIRTKVRSAVEQQLASGGCTHVEVASTLGMHPRTLQRRLRSEGENFEAIKDEVRRDAAVRYLKQTRLPLKTIAAMLGYSEISVLYRSCHRWFGCSPSQVRQSDELAAA